MGRGPSLFAWPARQPGPALAVALAVTIAALVGVTRLRFQSDLAELVPAKVRSAPALRRFQKLFADAEPTTVLVEGTEPAPLAAYVERLAAKAKRSKLVTDVADSLERDALTRVPPGEVFRYLDEPGFERLRAALAPDAVDASVRRLRALLLQPGAGAMSHLVREDPLGLRQLLAPSYERLGAGLGVDPTTGRFLAPDGRAALLLVRSRGSAFDSDFANRFAADLESRAAKARPPAGARVRLTGPPIVARDAERMIRGDLVRSTSLGLVLIPLVLFAAFGRLRAVGFLAIPLALGALWTAGFAGVALAGLSAISVAFGAIVLGLGDDASVHLLSSATALRRGGSDAREATVRALEEVGPAAAAAALTAALAFGALGLSSFRALRELGLCAAVGVVSTFLVAWLVLSPLLARSKTPVAVRAGPLEDSLHSLGALVARRRTVVVGAALVLLVAAAVAGLPAFAQRVVAVRPSRMPALVTQRDLFRIFGGSPGQWIALQEAGSLDEALEASEHLATHLRGLEKRGLVSGFDSLSALFPSTRAQHERRARWVGFPRDGAARALEASLDRHGLALAPFETAMRALREVPRSLVRPSERPDGAGKLVVRRHLRRRGETRVVATFFRPTEDVSVDRLAAAVRRADPKVALTGYPLLEHEVRALLPRDLARVGGVALLVVVAVLGLHFQSVRPLAASLGGLAAGMSALLVLLSALGVRWTAYNLVVLPVLLGISVDENVFFVSRYLRATGRAAERAATATREAGRAIATTAATTGVGFGVLLACDFDGLRDLGLTAALGIACCLVSSIVVLPAIAAMVIGDAGTIGRDEAA